MNIFEFQTKWNKIVSNTSNEIEELRKKGYWILKMEKKTGKSQKELSDVYDNIK